jgi:hypothetical protein
MIGGNNFFFLLYPDCLSPFIFHRDSRQLIHWELKKCIFTLKMIVSHDLKTFPVMIFKKGSRSIFCQINNIVLTNLIR